MGASLIPTPIRPPQSSQLPIEIAFDGSQGGSKMWPEHDVAVVVFRLELAFVLEPLVELDFGELVLLLHVLTGGFWVRRLGDRPVGTDLEENIGGARDSVVFGVQADDLALGVRLIPVDCDVVVGHRLRARLFFSIYHFGSVDDFAAGRLADAGDDSPPVVNVTFDLFESDSAGVLVGVDPLRRPLDNFRSKSGFIVVEDDTAAAGHALSSGSGLGCPGAGEFITSLLIAGGRLPTRWLEVLELDRVGLAPMIFGLHLFRAVRTGGPARTANGTSRYTGRSTRAVPARAARTA